MGTSREWPRWLWIVRHGESVGNIAAALAVKEGSPVIDLPRLELDVPLTPRGEQQAAALGHWLAEQPTGNRPTVILSSPYARAQETAHELSRAAGMNIPITIDERLREKDLGILNRLTQKGIETRYPEQLTLREQMGKFYYRPPGGESWCDVALRLRSFIGTLKEDYRQHRVLLTCHSVLVLLFRYLLESMTDSEILAIDHAGPVANCSVTSYTFDDDGKPHLELYNHVTPLEDAGAPVTEEPDAIRIPGTNR